MSHSKKIVCSVMAIVALITGGKHQLDESAGKYPNAISEVVIGGEFVAKLKISPVALELIGNAESCRRTPYVCPAGLSTDGIGNTHGVTGEIKSEDQIAKDWVRNIKSAEDCLITSAPNDALTQGQIDAFVSFIFNTGCTRFRHNRDGSETRIYKHIHHGRYTQACGELRYWIYGAGKKLPGLIIRRQKETELCLSSPA